MKYLEITPGKSINPNTGEQWRKVDVRVAVEEGEDPDEVYRKVMARIDSWLPNPFEPMNEMAKYSGVQVIAPDFTEEQITRDQQIQGYYEIIKMATTPKQLALHEPGIKRMDNKDLTEAYNNKLNSLT
jgi:hypothetical protein